MRRRQGVGEMGDHAGDGAGGRPGDPAGDLPSVDGDHRADDRLADRPGDQLAAHVGERRPSGQAAWRARVSASMRSRAVGWRLAVPAVCVAAGLLATTSMINANGTDLRGGRHTDLIGLVSEQRGDVQDLRRTVRGLQDQVDTLTEEVPGQPLQLTHQLAEMAGPAGLEALSGPGVVVTLDDAPRDQPGTDDIDP